jgi:hypothetical protein
LSGVEYCYSAAASAECVFNFSDRIDILLKLQGQEKYFGYGAVPYFILSTAADVQLTYEVQTRDKIKKQN